MVGFVEGLGKGRGRREKNEASSRQPLFSGINETSKRAELTKSGKRNGDRVWRKREKEKMGGKGKKKGERDRRGLGAREEENEAYCLPQPVIRLNGAFHGAGRF